MPSTPRIALSGTPGTGKTSVARRLARSVSTREVGDLAVDLGAGRRRGRSVDVSLAALGRRLERLRPSDPPTVVVGHLSHLLPIRDALVLRCHPIELDRRLRRARRGRRDDRRANVEAEATDVVLVEALSLGRRVWEIDTTGRSVAAVAREVLEVVRHRRGRRAPSVDWLADPRVTDYLIRPTR